MDETLKILDKKCEKYADYESYFIIGDHLGTGKFGSVYKATPTEKGIELIIRKNGEISIPPTLAIKMLSIGNSKISDFINEINALTKLKDIDHVGKTYGCMYQPSDLDTSINGSIVMEFVGGISLQTYTQNMKMLGPRNPMNGTNKEKIKNSVIQFCYELLQTVKLMHHHDIYHNDLHNGNVMIMLDQDKSISNFKIIDFGKMTTHNDEENSDFNMLSNLIFSFLALIMLKYKRLTDPGSAPFPIPTDVSLENSYVLDECICANLGVDLKSTNVMYGEIYAYFSPRK